jgi:hypothetical protein
MVFRVVLSSLKKRKSHAPAWNPVLLSHLSNPQPGHCTNHTVPAHEATDFCRVLFLVHYRALNTALCLEMNFNG